MISIDFHVVASKGTSGGCRGSDTINNQVEECAKTAASELNRLDMAVVVKANGIPFCW